MQVCTQCMIEVVTRTDLRAARARRTRAAIRAAALALVRECGYAAMTVDDVAALAGVSRRTVFNHFSSKADLLLIGPDAPEPEAVEAFASGDGPLLEDGADPDLRGLPLPAPELYRGGHRLSPRRQGRHDRRSLRVGEDHLLRAPQNSADRPLLSST